MHLIVISCHTSLFFLVTNVAAQAHIFFLQVLLFKKVMSCMVFAKMHLCFNANGAIRLILSNFKKVSLNVIQECILKLKRNLCVKQRIRLILSCC